MRGFLSGGLTVLICGEASMLSASIWKMFHLCMFAERREISVTPPEREMQWCYYYDVYSSAA